MNRIVERFARLKKAGKKGFIVYIGAGDPNLEATRQLALARRHGPVSGRRFDYGVQCGLPVRGRLGGAGNEIRRLEQRVSDVGNFGDFRLRRIVFSSDDGLGDNGERPRGPSCGIHNAHL